MISFISLLMRFFQAVRHSWKDPEFRGLFGLVVVTLLSGTIFYNQIEGWNLLDSRRSLASAPSSFSPGVTLW